MLAAFTPAAWGFLGAFCYAGPRLVKCFIHARDEDHGWGLCGFEFVVALGVGSIAAAALSSLALTIMHLRDHNAASALIGWVANKADAGAFLGNLIGRGKASGEDSAQ